LQKNDSSSYGELLQFVNSQRSSIEMYLSAAATISVSLLLHQIVHHYECLS